MIVTCWANTNRGLCYFGNQTVKINPKNTTQTHTYTRARVIQSLNSGGNHAINMSNKQAAPIAVLIQQINYFGGIYSYKVFNLWLQS